MIKPGQTVATGENEAASKRPTLDAPFGKALVEVGRRRTNVVGLTADLGKYTDIHPFRDAFPERYFNVGMAEQNLIAMAAGLARTGFIPFCTTYWVVARRGARGFRSGRPPFRPGQGRAPPNRERCGNRQYRADDRTGAGRRRGSGEGRNSYRRPAHSDDQTV